MKDFKLAVCQMAVTDDKQKNIEKSVCMIREAAANGAELVVLPEIFLMTPSVFRAMLNLIQDLHQML